jgi:ABC-2 type transport system ATP-binding protein
MALYDNLSGEENVTFIARIYGLRGSALKQAVDRALELVGLSDRRTDRAFGYSGGMKRRLNLACALVHDPPVLLLDEPTAGVDPQSRNHLLDSIASLARQGRTVLYTTHYMEEAQKLCRRVGVMDKGKLLAIGTVDELLAKYGGRSVVEVEVDGEPERKRFDSDDPLNDLTALAGRGAKVRSFRVDRPDLESVFLHLTGRRLRD